MPQKWEQEGERRDNEGPSLRGTTLGSRDRMESFVYRTFHFHISTSKTLIIRPRLDSASALAKQVCSAGRFSQSTQVARMTNLMVSFPHAEPLLCRLSIEATKATCSALLKMDPAFRLRRAFTSRADTVSTPDFVPRSDLERREKVPEKRSSPFFDGSHMRAPQIC